MKRYFGKIDEDSKNIHWELNDKTNDVLAKFSTIIHYSQLCIGTDGKLFAVFEEYKDEVFKVLFLSKSLQGMKEYFNFDEFTQADAYYWAKDIGDRDIMIDKITDSYFVYCWARDIGNKDVMIDRITNAEYAYFWAKDIGDKKIMKKKITDEYWMEEFEKLP